MKKTLCALMILALLPCFACAEATPRPTAMIQLITPTPTAQPRGETFSSEDLIVTLPLGFHILDASEAAGYNAALQADYPNAARTILLAANEDSGAVLSFAVTESQASAANAAAEAAKSLFDESPEVSQFRYGENSWASFSCSIGENAYNLYFLSRNGKLLALGASGIAEKELTDMLAGLIF